MRTSIIASFLASVLAITSVASTPAQAADRGEIGRFLLGAGTLLIIGGALTQADRSRNKGTTVYRKSTPTHKSLVTPHVTHKPTVKVRRKVVPAACLRNNRYDYGPKRFFGNRCLRKNMANAHRLPSNCLRTVWTNNGQRSVYGARCLRRNGWVFG